MQNNMQRIIESHLKKCDRLRSPVKLDVQYMVITYVFYCKYTKIGRERETYK